MPPYNPEEGLIRCVKTQVADVNRSLYDIKDEFEYSYKTDGLNEAVVRQISAQKMSLSGCWNSG